jgi:hypothetical protein
LKQKKLFAMAETWDLYREEAGFWLFVGVDETSQWAMMAEVSTTEVASRDR